MDELTHDQIAELEEARQSNMSPGEFAKWIIRKLREWLES